jgi:tyrosyl-tRNA synthetase
MNNIGNNLLERNLIANTTSDIIIDKLNKESITFYCGIDMTAPSLHLGHGLILKTIERLVKNGHKAIIILGGFTSKIGDPHGKNQERNILDNNTIEENRIAIEKQLYKILGEKGSITIVNNYNWLSKLTYEDFLIEYGKYLSVNQMIKLETASERLGKQLHLSLLEFNYMVLQGIDFYHLYNNYNCILQIGGSDQWGNILMGIDLVQKKLHETVFGLTIPLLINSNGKKMGKTEDGAIWLDEKMSNPYIMWQYLRNVDDKDVVNLLEKLSNYSVEEINDLFIKKDINDLKIILADEVIEWIHGIDSLNIIKQEIKRQFSKEGPQIFNLEEIKNSPSSKGLDKSIINNFEIEDLMVLTELVSSKSEAKRKILENAVKINGQLITVIKQKIPIDWFLKGVLCLELGKKHRRYLFLNN